MMGNAVSDQSHDLPRPGAGVLHFPRRFDWWWEVAGPLAIGLIYFALAWGCLALVHRTGRVSPLWPANAVVMVTLLRCKRRYWPRIFATAMLGNFAADLVAGDSPSLAIGLCFANSMEMAIATGGLLRWLGRDIDLTRRRDLIAFTLVAGLAAPLVAASFAVAWLKAPIVPSTLPSFGAWMMADALSALIVAPTLLSITPSALRELYAPRALRRNLLLLLTLVAVMIGVFGQSRLQLGALVFPVLLWATFSLEFAGAALGILITAAIALGFAMAGSGPTAHLYTLPVKQVLALQIFLAIATFSVLPVAAAVSRARRLQASLTASLAAAEAAHLETFEAQRWARMAQQIADVGYFRLVTDGPGSTWSDEVYRIHGVDPANGPLQATIEAVHPDDQAMVQEGLRAAREEAQPFSGQYRLHRSDGSWRTVSCRTVSELDAEGRVFAVIGALVDVTGFKEIEAAALESEARYRLLADKSSDIIARVGIDGLHTYISPASLPIVGYVPEELIGRLTMDFVHPDDQAALVETFERQAEDGIEHAVRPSRYRFRHKAGHWVWLETHPTAVFGEGGCIKEFISVSRDVTLAQAAEVELRAAREAAEAATQAKSEFLANMSHEIRTPLTSIMGFSGLLRELPELPEGARAYVERISTAGQSLLAVVNDILDFSKLEAGQVELDPHPFAAGAFITETAQLLAVQASNKGLDWRVEIEAGLPEIVLADSARLRQVLLNLMGNAIKFTAKGSVLVRASYDAADHGRLKVSVTDTGVGVPAERLDRLFQRFSQVDGSVSRIHGGTGLGLAICKSLVGLMGGEIGVVSKEGRGSTFWFVIDAPAAHAAPELDAPVEAEPEEPSAPQAARILIVDDLAVNRELVRAMLTPFGHTFEEASTGAEAVEAALRSGFDLILMDLQMPGMDGFEAARTIRATAPLNCGTPIIALSANVLPAHIIACKLAGMDDHLGKPIALPALVAKVATWAGEQHAAAPGAAVSLA
jgi:PAS domain S-box-containing protein